MKPLTKAQIKEALVKDIFEVEINPNLVHQVATSQMSNRRKVIASTKGRGEVRGGGKKPWRQKGTGRARHGSIRSPLWVGGGTTFGPTSEKNFKKTIPVKMRRKAMLMVLSEKAKRGEIVVVDSFELKEIKTKDLEKKILGLKLEGKSCLIVLPEMDEKMIKSAQNIQKVQTIQAKDLNCLDLLNYKYVVLTDEGIKKIKETFI